MDTPIELMKGLKCDHCGHVEDMPYLYSQSRIDIQNQKRTTTYRCPRCGTEKVML